MRLRRAMLSLSNHLDGSADLAGGNLLFPTGHAVMDMDKLSDLPHSAWVYRVRQLIRQIGGALWCIRSGSDRSA